MEAIKKQREEIKKTFKERLESVSAKQEYKNNLSARLLTFLKDAELNIAQWKEDFSFFENPNANIWLTHEDEEYDIIGSVGKYMMIYSKEILASKLAGTENEFYYLGKLLDESGIRDVIAELDIQTYDVLAMRPSDAANAEAWLERIDDGLRSFSSLMHLNDETKTFLRNFRLTKASVEYNAVTDEERSIRLYGSDALGDYCEIIADTRSGMAGIEMDDGSDEGLHSVLVFNEDAERALGEVIRSIIDDSFHKEVKRKKETYEAKMAQVVLEI